jgi:hypothetical protein
MVYQAEAFFTANVPVLPLVSPLVDVCAVLCKFSALFVPIFVESYRRYYTIASRQVFIHLHVLWGQYRHLFARAEAGGEYNSGNVERLSLWAALCQTNRSRIQEKLFCSNKPCMPAR